MQEIAELENIARNQCLVESVRLDALLRLVGLVRDPEEVLSYCEEHALGANDPRLIVARADLAERAGDLATAYKVFVQGSKRGPQMGEALEEHVRVIVEAMEEALLEQAGEGGRKRFPGRRGRPGRGRSLVNYQGLVIWVDPKYRNLNRGAELAASFYRDCSQFSASKKALYERVLARRPYSWITRELKKYKLVCLAERGQRLSSNSSKFGTPVKLDKKEAKRHSTVLSDSPEILKALFRRSPSFKRNPSVLRIQALTPPPKVRRRPQDRKVELIRDCQEEQFSFSKLNRASIEPDSQSENEAELECEFGRLIRESQLFYHSGQKSDCKSDFTLNPAASGD